MNHSFSTSSRETKWVAIVSVIGFVVFSAVAAIAPHPARYFALPGVVLMLILGVSAFWLTRYPRVWSITVDNDSVRWGWYGRQSFLKLDEIARVIHTIGSDSNDILTANSTDGRRTKITYKCIAGYVPPEQVAQALRKAGIRIDAD